MVNTFKKSPRNRKTKAVKRQSIKTDYQYLLEEVFELSCCNFKNSLNRRYLSMILYDIQVLYSHYHEEKEIIMEDARQECIPIESTLEIITVIRQQLLDYITQHVSVIQDKV